MDVVADQKKTCPTCLGSFPVVLDVCPRDGSALEAPGEWSIGQVIQGQYVIFRAADGDLATAAYRARALEFDEPRMLRVLRGPLAADDAASREFRRAARLLETLAHPNLVAVERTAEAEDGRTFLVTESVEGRNLDDLMRAEGPLTAERACRVARQIVSALEAVHRVGLLHLALEPRNILVSGPPEDERVKVQGMGSAYARMGRARRHVSAGPSARLTLRDLMPAAPAYSSPEQALGRAWELLDGRADLYALGVLVYQMLSGRLPVEPAGSEGDAALAWLGAHLAQEPLPLASQERGRAIPQPLADLVMHLLEKRPELRPPTAQALADAIELVEGSLTGRATLQPQFHPGPAERFPEVALEPTAAASAAPERRDEAELEPLMPAAGTLAEARLAEVMLHSAPAQDGAVGGPLPTAPSKAGQAAPQAPLGERAGETAHGGAAYTSPLFRPAPSPPPVSRTRWVLAVLATLVVAAGAVFFMTRGRNQWLGAGPASPIKSDELRSVEGADAKPVPPPASPVPSAGSAGQGSANPAESPKPASPEPAPTQAGAPPVGPPTHPAPASPRIRPPGARLPHPAAAAITRPAAPAKTPPAPAAARPAPEAREIAGRVQHAVDAGDVFFGLGQYDLAIQAYQGPLQLDPKNKMLRDKIARAKKAKTAEQQFLEQP
ncbi:MAG TPA: protein kinase [Terriglobia bacterium]|nr:protein kinase [Terriglobia bacterium]